MREHKNARLRVVSTPVTVRTFPNNQVQEFVIPLQCSTKPLLLSICRLFYTNHVGILHMLKSDIQAKWRNISYKHCDKQHCKLNLTVNLEVLMACKEQSDGQTKWQR